MSLRITAILSAVTAVGIASAAVVDTHAPDQAKGPVVTVYKSPTCGCCGKWVEHMKAAGFQVRTVDLDDLTEVKQTSGVPMKLRTCHTGLVEGYVIEGHVPADLVKRLLAEKPKMTGMAVPGMPMGSPGMDGPTKDGYEVLLFDKTGKTTVYAKR